MDLQYTSQRIYGKEKIEDTFFYLPPLLFGHCCCHKMCHAS